MSAPTGEKASRMTPAANKGAGQEQILGFTKFQNHELAMGGAPEAATGANEVGEAADR